MGLSFYFLLENSFYWQNIKCRRRERKKNTVMFKSYWRITYMEYKIGQKFETEVRNRFHLRNIITRKIEVTKIIDDIIWFK